MRSSCSTWKCVTKSGP